jgi:hypothetical protein
VQRGRSRLATWTEVRRRADNELLSVHTLDDKLGRWWHVERVAGQEAAPVLEKTGPVTMPPSMPTDVAPGSASQSAAGDIETVTATTEPATTEPVAAAPATAESATAELVTAEPANAERVSAEIAAGEPYTPHARVADWDIVIRR